MINCILSFTLNLFPNPPTVWGHRADHKTICAPVSSTLPANPRPRQTMREEPNNVYSPSTSGDNPVVELNGGDTLVTLETQYVQLPL